MAAFHAGWYWIKPLFSGPCWLRNGWPWSSRIGVSVAQPVALGCPGACCGVAGPSPSSLKLSSRAKPFGEMWFDWTCAALVGSALRRSGCTPTMAMA
jgi:hypothetical protein